MYYVSIAPDGRVQARHVGDKSKDILKVIEEEVDGVDYASPMSNSRMHKMLDSTQFVLVTDCLAPMKNYEINVLASYLLDAKSQPNVYGNAVIVSKVSYKGKLICEGLSESDLSNIKSKLFDAKQSFLKEVNV